MRKVFDKTMISRAVISKIEDDQSPKAVRTKHIVGYENPSSISINGKDTYIPDITAVMDNGTNVYEIELNKTANINKWRSMSLFAKKNKGDFYIVTPDYLKESIKEKLADNDVNAGLIFFNTEKEASA